jgi:hypothetical protein
MRALAAVLVLCSTLAAWGCGEGAESRVSVDTVGGVPQVTTSGPGLWSEDERWTVGERVLRLGTLEGDGPESFGRVASLAAGPDGRVYVADGQAMEVRVFGPDGSFLRSFGRRGEGPGEFEAVDGVALGPEGTVYVRDPRLARVSRFDPGSGELLDSFPLERTFMIFSAGTTLWVDDEGRVWDKILLNLDVGEPDRHALVRYPPIGGEPDTLILGEREAPRVLAVDSDGNPRVGLRIPFSASAEFVVAPDGRSAWGIGDDYVITVRGPGGDTLRAFGRSLEADRVTSSEAEAARATLREQVRDLAPSATLQDYDLPGVKPLFDEVVADRTGHWWVRRFRWARPDSQEPSGAEDQSSSESEPYRYDVFEPEGRFLGTVEIPEMRVMVIGRHFVAGVETDELGVEYVAVYELVKPEGAS